MVYKPTDEAISKAIRHSVKHRSASPVMAEAFDTLYQYRHWADAELELAARQEKHLAQKIVELRVALAESDSEGRRAQREFDRRLKAKDTKIEEVERALSDSEDRLAEASAERDQAVNLQEALITDLHKAQDDLRLMKGLHDKTHEQLKAAQIRLLEIAAYQRENKSFRAENVSKATEITKLRQENENLHKSLRDAGVAPRPQWLTDNSEASLNAQIAALSGPEQPKGKSYADTELGVIQDCLNALERIPSMQRAAITNYLTSRAHSASWGAMPKPSPVPPW